MKEPKLWGSVLSAEILNAYEAGKLTYEADSIRKWYDGECGKVYSTTFSDIQDIRRVIDYYKEGNSLPDRARLQQVIDMKEEAKAKAKAEEAKSKKITFRVFETATGKDVTDEESWYIDQNGDLYFETNDIDSPMVLVEDHYYEIMVTNN